MGKRFDNLCIWIDFLCGRYPMRVVESCMAVILLAPAAYAITERVRLAGLVGDAPYLPIWVFAAVLFATCVAHQVGIFMPMIHRCLAGRGVSNRWLAKPWFNELTWRRWCCGLEGLEMGFYAAIISQVRPVSWLLAFPYIVIVNTALIRLGGARDANRTGTDDTLVGERPARFAWWSGRHLAISDVSPEKPAEKPAEHRIRPVSYQAEVDRCWGEPADGLREAN